MEVCVPSSKSPYLDGCSNRGSLKIPLKTTHNNPTDLSVSDLKTCLAEVLVRDGIDVRNSEKNDVSNVKWEHGIKDLDKNKSALPASENQEPSSSIDQVLLEEKQEQDTTGADLELKVLANSINQSRLQSKSLPTTSKLLSALKGSRAKQGMPPKKLSVTWAPDVYDPIPTSVSHVPSSKNQHYRSYGKRKNKQKRGSKSSRSGGGSKDSREKKQTRKNAGTSSKLKPIPDYDRGIEALSSNPFCGSSLLLENSEHFPPAEEAT